MNFDEFLESISKIKNIPLPAEASQFKMVPSFRQELLRQQKDAIKNAKKAGVLALFYPNNENETTFVLILRKVYKGAHSGQVAFPGGKLDLSINRCKMQQFAKLLKRLVYLSKILRLLEN